jgi:hypothetical protein
MIVRAESLNAPAYLRVSEVDAVNVGREAPGKTLEVPMRSMFRVFTVTGLVASAAMALDAQPLRRPVRPIPPEARERQLELRERMLERREAMLERRGGRGPEAGLRAGPGGRPGMRAGMAPRMGGRAGLRARGGRAGLRAGAAARIERRAIARERYEALQPAQREALHKYRESARTERFRVGEEVRAGKLTREQARERLTKWRETNKPPVDLRAPRPNRPEGSE